MDRFAPNVLAFASSVLAGGVVQQVTLIHILGARDTTSALIPLGIAIFIIATIYAVVFHRTRAAALLNRITTWLVGLGVVGGAFALWAGYSSASPGIGGNIAVGLAIVAVTGFLAPLI